jgi:MFS family permease
LVSLETVGEDARVRRSVMRGWRVVAGAFVVMFMTFGCTYAFTAFFASLQESFGVSRGALSGVFSVAGSLYFFLGALSGPLADRFGPRPMILFGTTAVGVGLIMAGRAQDIREVYAAYGIGIGVGVGFAYVPAIGAVQRWFVARRGFASGIAVAGIGLGTLIVPPVADWLIATQGWRAAYGTLGVACILAAGAAAFAVEGSPERHGFLPDGQVIGVGGEADAAVEGVSVKEAVRSRAFAMLYSAAFLVSLGLFAPFVHLTPYAEDRGVPHALAVALFALIGVGSTAGRFLIGGFADRLGRRRALGAMYLGVALTMGWWLASTQAWQIGVFALVFGACYGGFVALAPALIVDYFGPRNASSLIGLSYTAVALGTLAGPPLAGYAFDVYRSYTLPIAVSAVAAIAAAVLVRIAPDPATERARPASVPRRAAS